MFPDKTKGFTLIELLVVISIIGTLSSIVLSSLNTARNKGKDASVAQQLNDMRTASSLLFDTSGSADAVCDPSSNPGKMFRAAYAAGSKTLISTCVSTSNTYYVSDASGNLNSYNLIGGRAITREPWAASIALNSGKYYCVDYTGAGTTTNAQPTIDFVALRCP